MHGTAIKVDPRGSLRFMVTRAPAVFRVSYLFWGLLSISALVAGLFLIFSDRIGMGAGLMLVSILILASVIRHAVAFVGRFSLLDVTFRRHASEAGAIRRVDKG